MGGEQGKLASPFIKEQKGKSKDAKEDSKNDAFKIKDVKNDKIWEKRNEIQKPSEGVAPLLVKKQSDCQIC